MHPSTLHRDERDVALEHLAADECELRARVADLEADNVTLRELLREALAVAHHLHGYKGKYKRTLDENDRLRAELRALRPRRAA